MTAGRGPLHAHTHRVACQRGMKLTPAQRAQRDLDIDRMYEDEGMTLEAIGIHFGVSRERIRQLRVARGKRKIQGTRAGLYKAFMAIVRDPRTVNLRTARGKARTLSHGYLLDAVLIEFNAPTLAITRLIRMRKSRLLLDQLRALGAGLGRTPGAEDMTRANREGLGVSVNTYMDHFGTIREAQRRAGFTPNPLGRRPTTR